MARNSHGSILARAACLGLVSLAILAAWWRFSPPRAEARAPVPAVAAAVSPSVPAPPAAVATASAPKGAPAGVSAVRAEVKRGNEAEREQRRSFERAGWQFVDAPPPNPGLENLDPTLLGTRARELQVQLQTNTYTGDRLARVADLAIQARDEQTRHAALESLGRSPDERAQDELIRAYGALGDEGDRSAAMEQLHPRSAGDRATSFLLAQLADPAVSAELKRQAVAALAGLALAGRAGYDELLQSVPADWQGEFRAIYARARAGGGKTT